MTAEAFYYPYTTIRSHESLKAMVLYFDTIHIMKPMEVSIGNAGSISNEIDTLEEEGVIKYISPSQLLSEYDDVVTKSVLGDLTDPIFLKYCSKQNLPKPWKIYAEKVPSALADAIFRKYLVNIPNFYIGEHLKHKFPEEGPYVRRHSEMYEMMHEVSSVRAKRYREMRMVELPFEVGESLMINHALCACHEFLLTPLTDHKVHHDFLLFKMNRMKDTALAKRLLVDAGFIKDVNTDLTSVEVISETVPMLYKARISDVLEFRDQNRDALKKFKIEMHKVMTEVEGNSWDGDLYQKVVDIVDGKVRPAIQEIKDSVESTRDKFLRIIRKGVEISSIPILATIIPGIDPAVGLMAGAGLIALDEYLESSQRKRTKRKNGFAYLYEAQKKFKMQ